MSVTVNNVAPQNVEGGNDQTVNEGDLVSLSGSFTDPGSADTHTFVWHVVAGNGQTITNGTGQNFSFTPNDNGSYAVTFTVTDDDAGANSDNFTVTVDNVAPSITDVSVIPNPIDEGATTLVKITATDPGTADTLTYEFDCDDDLVYEIGPAGAMRRVASTTTARTTTTINVRVSDDDGGSDVEASSVHVDNVAPTATLANDGPVDEGSSGHHHLQRCLRSSSGRHQRRLPLHLRLRRHHASAGQLCRGRRAGQHDQCTFNDNGSYTVFGRIIDKDDGYTSYTTLVTVNNVAPRTSRLATTRPSTRATLVSLSAAASPIPARPTPTPYWTRGRRQRPGHHQRQRLELQLHAQRQRQLHGHLHRH